MHSPAIYSSWHGGFYTSFTTCFSNSTELIGLLNSEKGLKMLFCFLFHLQSLERGRVSTYLCTFSWNVSNQKHISNHTLCHSFHAIFFCLNWEAKVGKCFVACLSLFLPIWMCKPQWLCEPGWLLSYESGMSLDCPRSGYRPHSTHLFASPSISSNWWSSISSSSEKSVHRMTDTYIIQQSYLQRFWYMGANLGEIWVWSWLRKRFFLSHSSWDLRTPPVYSKMKPSSAWRCFTEARDPDPCLSASLTHTREWGALVQCAALFNSLMRY